GGAVQARAYHRGSSWRHHRADAAQVLAIHGEIIRRSADTSLKAPVVCCDWIVDYLPTVATAVWAREHYGQEMICVQTVGVDPMLTDDAVILSTLQRSDFVVLSAGVLRHADYYPYHQRMNELRPRFREYCEREMVLVHSCKVLGERLDVYARGSVAK